MSDTRPLDHLADARITGPLVFGAITDQRPSHRAVGVEDVGLVQRSDPQSAAPGDPPGIRAHLTGEQIQQTRFAVAVSSHDADAIAVADPDGRRFEDDPSRILQVYCLGAQQMCHRPDPSRMPGRGDRRAGATRLVERTGTVTKATDPPL